MDSLLSSLPAEILLEIIGSLKLQDAVTLSTTCHRLWSLSHERAFWTKTLEATRFSRPLPCPLYEDFSKLDLPALKGLVRHAMRLEQNWSQEKPQISGPIQSFSLGSTEGDIKILFNIPGTPFIVTHTEEEGGSMTCWSRTTGKALCSVVTGGEIEHKSTIHQGHGSCSIAVRVVCPGRPSDVLMVLRVQYGPGREVSMKIVFRHDSAPGFRHACDVSAISLDSHIVAYLGLDTQMSIVAFNMASGKAITIATDLPRMYHFVDMQIFERKIYIHSKDKIVNALGYFYYFPSHMLPYPDNMSVSSRSVIRCHETTEPYEYGRQEVGDLLVFDLDVYPSGFSGMLLTVAVSEQPDIELDGTTKTTVSYFSMPSVESRKTPPTPVQSYTLHDQVKHDQFVATPWSSACFVSEDGELNEMLKLVRFHPDTHSVSVHSLEQIPPYIDLDQFDRLEMVLDDHLGVVIVLDDDGILFSIPYA